MYVNQYFTMRNREIGTKHVFAGTTRVVSKLMKQDKPGANPKGKTPLEKDLYFFHPDHLGSSNYITDTQGKLYEHLEYFPFGETWVEESTNTQRTPYLFTSKELDEETGLYYFGARYYDPRTSVWQSGDPALEKYIPDDSEAGIFGLRGLGGVYNSRNIGVYGYAGLNPLIVVDPNGSDIHVYFQKGGPGHVGIAIDDPNRKGKIITFDYGMAGWLGMENATNAQIAKSLLSSSDAYINSKTRASSFIKKTSDNVTFKTSKEFDTKLLEKIKATILDEKVTHGGKKYPKASKSYNAITCNCADYVEAVLSAATGGEFSDYSVYPESTFKNIKASKESIQAAINKQMKAGKLSDIDFKDPEPAYLDDKTISP